MKKCPQCLSTFGDTMENCPNCGCALEYAADNNAPANGAPVQNNGYAYNPYTAPQFKYCPRCGNKCDPMAVVCVKCGSPFQNANMMSAQDDTPSLWIKIACFFVPILGLILYLTERDKRPICAKAYGKMSLIGLIIRIVLVAIYVIFVIAMMIIGMSAVGWDDEWYYDDDYYYYYNGIKTALINVWTMLK